MYYGYTVYGPTVQDCKTRRERFHFFSIHGSVRIQENFDWAYQIMGITPTQAEWVDLTWKDVKQYCLDLYIPIPDWLRYSSPLE